MVADLDPGHVFREQAELVAIHLHEVLVVTCLEKHAGLVGERGIEDDIHAIGLSHGGDGPRFTVIEGHGHLVLLDHLEAACHDLVEPVQIQAMGRRDNRQQIVYIVSEEHRLGHLICRYVGHFGRLFCGFGFRVFDDFVGHPMTVQVCLDGRCHAHLLSSVARLYLCTTPLKYSWPSAKASFHSIMGKMKQKKRRKNDAAAQADRHRLYELSVQCAEAEVDFVEQTFEEIRGRKARHLREDFCGTANVCCEWVRRSGRNTAVGVDLDAEVLDWGRHNRLAELNDKQRARVALIQGNVLNAENQPVDMLLAMNFSYWLFKERSDLLRYFKVARNNLVDDGIMFLDAYGGYDSFREIDEEREIDDGGEGFTYIWDQDRFNPIDNNLICHIHFAFPDGSVMEQAFSYDWRLYTLPEIRDLLDEAGFSKVTVYWQGWDENGEASGEFYPAEEADADAGWICYLVAEK